MYKCSKQPRWKTGWEACCRSLIVASSHLPGLSPRALCPLHVLVVSTWWIVQMGIMAGTVRQSLIKRTHGVVLVCTHEMWWKKLWKQKNPTALEIKWAWFVGSCVSESYKNCSPIPPLKRRFEMLLDDSTNFVFEAFDQTLTKILAFWNTRYVLRYTTIHFSP